MVSRSGIAVSPQLMVGTGVPAPFAHDLRAKFTGSALGNFRPWSFPPCRLLRTGTSDMLFRNGSAGEPLIRFQLTTDWPRTHCMRPPVDGSAQILNDPDRIAIRAAQN